MKGQLISTEIAEPYAQALMSIAQGHGLVDRFGDELRNLLEIMAESPELETFIANPIIEEPQKKAVINEIVGRDFHPYLVNFLMLLVDKRRSVFLKEVCEQYLAELRQLNNIILAEVTTATEINDEQRRAIADKVRTLTGASEVELAVRVNSELIGGVIIKVGSQVFDTSLKGQLRRIGLSLSRGA